MVGRINCSRTTYLPKKVRHFESKCQKTVVLQPFAGKRRLDCVFALNFWRVRAVDMAGFIAILVVDQGISTKLTNKNAV
jgi:hypothetical protein